MRSAATMATKTAKHQPYYNYHPLPAGSIRLLQIDSVLASSNPLDDLQEDLKISLHDYPLSSCPDYVALSYTWGEANGITLESTKPQIFTQEARCFPISCDGQIIRGTCNLRSALRYLRLILQDNRRVRQDNTTSAEDLYFVNDFGCTERFWIDALCIDQDDVFEKQQQIPLMGQIYRRAQLCLVWLGEADEWSDSALPWMTKISKDECLNDNYHDRDLESESKFRQRFQEILSETSSSVVLGAQLFLSRAWFQRVWILQEAVLPEKVRFACGVKIGTLDSLLVAAAFMGRASTQCLTEILHNRHWMPALRLETVRAVVRINQDTVKRLSRLFECRQLTKTGRDPGDLSFLAARALSSGTQASVLHDHVYGILGLTRGLQETRSDGKLEFQINYQQSVEQVYVCATASVVQHENNLDFLYLVSSKEQRTMALEQLQWQKTIRNEGIEQNQARNARLHLPSWCPDYSLGASADEMLSTHDDAALPPSPWRSQQPTIEIKDGSVLVVDGIYRDKVGRVYAKDGNVRQEILQMLELIVNLDMGTNADGLVALATQLHVWCVCADYEYYL